MGWFRAKRRMGGRLALFALALQLFLSFGHLHPDDIYGSLKAPSPTQTVSLATAGPEQFADSNRSTLATDDLCAICASVSLLSSSFVAQPPKLSLPEPQTVEHAAGAVAFAIAPPRAPFQSRAPPAA